jgi:hypothetical protein
MLAGQGYAVLCGPAWGKVGSCWIGLIPSWRKHTRSEGLRSNKGEVKGYM